MNQYIIKTTSLSYHYSKDDQTLSDINLNIEKGSIYGFLGPNGSGKTTTLSLLLGLLKNQQGKIEIFGKDFKNNRIEILKRIGSLIESPSLYGHLTAKENLEVYRTIYNVKKERLDEVLEIVGLEDTGNKTIKKFSLGMKQRLAIALALLPKPELLVLDEPTNGLDPAGIIELRKLIRKLNKAYGMTILISSHLLSEVEKMVSHVGIIFKGKMLFQGTLYDLNQLHHSKLIIHTSDNNMATKVLKNYHPEQCDDNITVAYNDERQVAEIGKTLIKSDLDIYMLYPKKLDLEQLFINLTATHP